MQEAGFSQPPGQSVRPVPGLLADALPAMRRSIRECRCPTIKRDRSDAQLSGWKSSVVGPGRGDVLNRLFFRKCGGTLDR